MQGYHIALLTTLLLLPGTFAVWAFQRWVPWYGRRLRDWLLRLLGISAACAVVGAWPLYWLYANYWNAFVEGEPLPRALVPVPFAYLALPGLAGWLFGQAVFKGKDWAVRLAGTDRAPLAWDHLFEAKTHGIIRCRLKDSGRWVGGYYAASSPDGLRSYASDDPDNRDIYISVALELDEGSGKPVIVDEEHVLTGGGVLLKWSDVETLEFQRIRPEDHEKGESSWPGEQTQLRSTPPTDHVNVEES